MQGHKSTAALRITPVDEARRKGVKGGLPVDVASSTRALGTKGSRMSQDDSSGAAHKSGYARQPWRFR